jgi:hypothetical protein
MNPILRTRSDRNKHTDQWGRPGKTALPTLISALLLALALSSPALAQSPLTDTPVPAYAATQLNQARKMGDATLRWFGLKVYDISLYSDKTPQGFNYRSDRYLLELKYDKSLDGPKIAEKSRELIESQGEGKGQLDQWQKKLTDIIPDVQKNTRLAALHLPGKGMLLYRDGQQIAELTDADLATAFMGIWLDTRTTEPYLREKLLGLKK